MFFTFEKERVIEQSKDFINIQIILDSTLHKISNYICLSLEYHSIMLVVAYAVALDQVLHTEQHTSEAASDDDEC